MLTAHQLKLQQEAASETDLDLKFLFCFNEMYIVIVAMTNVKGGVYILKRRGNHFLATGSCIGKQKGLSGDV